MRPPFSHVNRCSALLWNVVDKAVIFGNESGVSMNGDLVLCSEEVPQQWSRVSMNILFRSHGHLACLCKTYFFRKVLTADLLPFFLPEAYSLSFKDI